MPTLEGAMPVAAAILAFLLAGRRDEFAAALSGARVLAVTVVLQIALLARSEAWHLTIRVAGQDHL
jgi:hypothetical protein